MMRSSVHARGNSDAALAIGRKSDGPDAANPSNP
jgi:hypothetical protein